jgi:PAS domain S-box-containing protein
MTFDELEKELAAARETILAMELEHRVDQRTAALGDSEARYRNLFETMTEGFSLDEIICDEAGTPCDLRYLAVNPAFERHTGLKSADIVGRTTLELFPDAEPVWFERYGKVAITGEPAHFEARFGPLDRWFEVRAFRTGPGRFAAMFMDITERKQAEEALRQAVGELKRSNQDLEQFAYVASHDLQEPLRQVRAFVSLLQTRHADKLDGKAAEYFQFVCDGAARMSSLVQGLLDYARVGSNQKRHEPASCQMALDEASANLRASIDESHARITHDDLPTVMAEPTQLEQLFQNLIGNAIKFHRDGVPPQVHVGCRRDGQEWVLSVRDNGIGIAPEYREQVFMIFQRLHGRGKYPGTGIGLAICKKIVERHGGKMWVESKPGEGSTFCLTLSAAVP